MTLKIAQFLSTMLFALVMGVFWGTWFTLSRSIEGFQPQTFLDIGQTAIRNLAVPIDNQIKVWTIATLPANWEMFRDRWEFYHGVRTCASIFALAFISVSSLSNRPY